MDSIGIAWFINVWFVGALGQYYLTDRPTTSQLHSAISPRDTAECFETSSALALPSLFGTAKAVVKSFIG